MRTLVAPGGYVSTAGIVRHVVEGVRPGSIGLLHVWHGSRQTSRAAVPLIVDALQAKGYRFVTVSELVGVGE